MEKKFIAFANILRADPAVAQVGGYAGGGATNSGNLFVTLKPPGQRGGVTTNQVIDRLRPALSNISGRGCSCRRRSRFAPADGSLSPATNIPSKPTRWTNSTPGCRRSPNALQAVPELTDVNSTSRTRDWKWI